MQGSNILCTDYSGRTFMRSVCAQPLTGPHVRLTNRPNRTTLGYYIWIHPTPPGCILNCPGALVPISADIPQDNIHLFIRSISFCCQACIQAQKQKLLSTILSCCNEISAKYTSLPHFYSWIFRVSIIQL